MGGKWISRDLYNENSGFNLYLYCKNTVINKFDIFGLICEDKCKKGQVKNLEVEMGFKYYFDRLARKTPPEDYSSLKMLKYGISVYPAAPGKFGKIWKQQKNFYKEAIDVAIELLKELDETIQKKSDALIVWYRYKAQCCKCSKCAIFAKRYDWVDVTEEWDHYPKKDIGTTIESINQFSRDSLIDYVYSLREEKLTSICR